MDPVSRRALVLLLAGALTLCAVPSVDYATDVSDADQAEIDDLNQQYEELEQQQQEYQAQIDAAKSEKDKYLAEKNQLNGQIDNTQAQIDVLTNKIDLLNSMIAENDATIAELEDEIDKDYEIFRQRARASYMSGDSSTVSLLLGADSFSDWKMIPVLS